MATSQTSSSFFFASPPISRLQLNDPNIDRINKQWRLHHKEASGESSRCLACLLDPRFILTDEMQLRIALSFGHNPYTTTEQYGFVPPPIHPGKYVFGLHLVATKNNQLTLYDQWMNGFESGDDANIDRAVLRGGQLLNGISDEEFQSYLHEFGPIRHSLMANPEVVRAEAF